MPIIDSAIRSIECDGGCGKKVLFDRKDEQVTFQQAENSWLKSARVVQSFDGRNFLYCGDECEVKGASAGKHNIPKIIQAGTQAQVNDAVALAAARQQADAAIREGGVPGAAAPGRPQLVVTDK